MTLKEARRKRGFTQMELAAILGVTQTTLSLIETHKVMPRPKTKQRLQKIFGNEVEFYPVSVLIEMISRFIGRDSKTAPQRGKFLKEHINKVIQCIDLDYVVKLKTK